MPVSDRRPSALITGASSGIGAAFARHLAADGYDLVLVARDSARLEQLAREVGERHHVSVEVLAADLTDDAGCAEVEHRLQRSERPTDLLINNAGLAAAPRFDDGPVEAEEHMLRLNVRAVMRLTHAFVPVALERGSGEILNVSSVASFAPVSPGSTYSSTKAWVRDFSESLHLLLADRGVQVMALCPGFVRTEFHQRAGLPTNTGGRFWWLTPEKVVAIALKKLRRGNAVCIPTTRYWLLAGVLHHVPRGILYPLLKRVRGSAMGRIPAEASEPHSKLPS